MVKSIDIIRPRMDELYDGVDTMLSSSYTLSAELDDYIVKKYGDQWKQGTAVYEALQELRNLNTLITAALDKAFRLVIDADMQLEELISKGY